METGKIGGLNLGKPRYGKYYSVTQILGTLGQDKYKFVSIDILKKAAERGSEVHRVIADYALSTNKNESDLSNAAGFDCSGFVGFENYFLPRLGKILGVVAELESKSDTLGYAGTMDLVYEIESVSHRRKFLLIDVKTRKHDPLYDFLQLAGYTLLLKEIFPLSEIISGILELKKNGQYQVFLTTQNKKWQKFIPVFHRLKEGVLLNKPLDNTLIQELQKLK